MRTSQPHNQQNYYMRRVISMIAFFSAWFCLIQFFIGGREDYYMLLLMLGLFITAYFVAPYANGKNTAVPSAWDIWTLEFFFDVVLLPIRGLLYVIRHVFD